MSGMLREVQGNAVHASPTTRPDAGLAPGPAPTPASVNPRRGLIIATVAGLFMTFVGALGTGEAPFWTRLGYWMLVMETGALIGLGASLGIQHWGRLRERPVIEGGLIAFLIAVPLSIVVVSSNALFFETRSAGILDFAFVAGVVFVVSCVITAINYATNPAAPIVMVEAAAETSTASPSDAPARFMARLPMRLRHARLIALEAEDHYLRVHTDAGSELILMRLGDAVAELDGLDGSRTHRSWWVARAAVVDVVVVAGRVSLVLNGGLTAPVSRASKPVLAQAGWLD